MCREEPVRGTEIRHGRVLSSATCWCLGVWRRDGCSGGPALVPPASPSCKPTGTESNSGSSGTRTRLLRINRNRLCLALLVAPPVQACVPVAVSGQHHFCVSAVDTHYVCVHECAPLSTQSLTNPRAFAHACRMENLPSWWATYRCNEEVRLAVKAVACCGGCLMLGASYRRCAVTRTPGLRTRWSNEQG